ALYSKDGSRAFITDKTDGMLMEVSPKDKSIVARLIVGKEPQQPAMTRDGRMFIPLSGEAAVAVVSTNGGLQLESKLAIGEGTKPHIVSLTPDEKTLFVTVQGRDPKVVAIDLTQSPPVVVKEFRYDIVPRVVAASNSGAYFTGHHSTGLHFVNASETDPTKALSTPFMDVSGAFSEAKKQIEGIDVAKDDKILAITHEGRKALLVLNKDLSGKLKKRCEFSPLAAKPYWTSLDPEESIVYVSIPDAGLVEAYDFSRCSKQPLWSVNVGGKAKRMAIK
ncbi:MAG: hypothetical protein AAB250_07005, partial [Bdellovibrionota bacterium]